MDETMDDTLAQTKDETKMRNVVGKDRIVTYIESSDTVSVKHIHASQGDNGRFSPEALLETLGFTEDEATIQFVMNNNLHDDGKGCRGVVLLVNLCIGMIVKSIGSFILFHVLYPRRKSGFRIIDLRKKNRHYGFYLEQIRGHRIGALSTHRHGGNPNAVLDYPYCQPYCIDGKVYMDPAGPDFCVSVTMDTVEETNSALSAEFKSLKENLCTRSKKKTPSRIRNLRKATTKSNVLYVVDSQSRVDMGTNADMFYIPVGISMVDVKCPWKNTNRSTGGM